MAGSDRVRFLGVVRTPADPGPDPGVTVERTRDADGTERITFGNATGRPLRLPVELALGTDLAALGAVAAGRAGPELRASVHGTGLRWSAPDGAQTVVTADPPPKDALASAGVLRWELVLGPGRAPHHRARRPHGPGGPAGRTQWGQTLLEGVAEGDDPRVEPLLRACLDDLRALLVRDPAHPGDLPPRRRGAVALRPGPRRGAVGRAHAAPWGRSSRRARCAAPLGPCRPARAHRRGGWPGL